MLLRKKNLLVQNDKNILNFTLKTKKVETFCNNVSMICKEVYLVIISIIVYMDIIDTESRIYFTVHRGTQTDKSFFD
jgi:hypothetical protein